MAKLPFVVEPRFPEIIELIGSEESGKIKVARKGYLTAGEKAFSQGSLGESEAASIMFSLIRRAVAVFKIDQKEAHNLVNRLIQEEGASKKEQDFKESIAPEIDRMLIAVGEYEKRKRFVYAFTLLHYRVDPNLTVEDSLEIHPDLMDALADLFEEEEKKSISRLEEAFSGDTSDEVEKVAKAAEKK